MFDTAFLTIMLGASVSVFENMLLYKLLISIYIGTGPKYILTLLQLVYTRRRSERYKARVGPMHDITS
jgi:hypothetical protein